MCRRLRDASPTLRASALLALCKLMCLEATFCDTNLQLVFTLLQNRQGPSRMQSPSAILTTRML